MRNGLFSIALVATLGLAGCANTLAASDKDGFSKSYKPLAAAAAASQASASLLAIYQSNIEQVTHKGYVLIGYSVFDAPQGPQTGFQWDRVNDDKAAARAQARKVGATYVLITNRLTPNAKTIVTDDGSTRALTFRGESIARATMAYGEDSPQVERLQAMPIARVGASITVYEPRYRQVAFYFAPAQGS